MIAPRRLSAGTARVFDRVTRRMTKAIGGALVLLLAACASPTDVAEEATDVAVVRCEPSGTWVQPAAVSVRSDGVRLSIDNRADRKLSVYTRIAGAIGPLTQVDVGVTDTVSTSRPGSWELLCLAGNAYPTEQSPWVGLEVVDPEGLWVSDVLECDVIAASHPDYAEDFEGGTPAGQTGDPVELSRDSIAGAGFLVLEDDVLERAGYPEAESVHVRVVRDGRVVAIGSWQAADERRWIDRGAEYCDDL
jgi:hypothetical protein